MVCDKSKTPGSYGPKVMAFMVYLDDKGASPQLTKTQT